MKRFIHTNQIPGMAISHIPLMGTKERTSAVQAISQPRPGLLPISTARSTAGRKKEITHTPRNIQSQVWTELWSVLLGDATEGVSGESSATGSICSSGAVRRNHTRIPAV